jgi:hypothetical protein
LEAVLKLPEDAGHGVREIVRRRGLFVIVSNSMLFIGAILPQAAMGFALRQTLLWVYPQWLGNHDSRELVPKRNIGKVG